MAKDTTVGIDLAKTVFYVVIQGPSGTEKQRKRLRRSQLLKFMTQLAPCTVAMEACGGAHHWAREFEQLGHHVELLPPQHVKGYLRGQKNDYNDARAIAEACYHGAIRTVRIKSVEQQDEQALQRMRRSLEGERTRLVNQQRGLLAEYGVVISRGVAAFRREVPRLLEDGEAPLTERFRALLARQYRRLLALEEELAWYDAQLRQQVKTDDVCRRLVELPGFGPVVSTAFKSWIGDGQQFRRGRDASAALGIVPRQHSSGGKNVLLGISKRGDSYVRSLVIHGARSVVLRARHKDDPLSRWINELVARRGFNKAVVALANKLVRMAWVIVARQESYCPRPVV